jgi:xanthine dehydrogenase accessory factor
MRALIDELIGVLDRGLSCAFCTVVATKGPTPQKAGATLLVYPDGTQAGTLGGGCVEAEVRQRAIASLNAAEPKPEIHVFDLDDDYGWDDGLICGGRMTIVADPVSTQRLPYFRTLQRMLETGVGLTEVVALAENPIGLPPGVRALFDAENRPVESPTWAATVAKNLPRLATRPRPSVSDGFAVLPVPPRIRLLIVGGGHVGQAVGKLAAETEFEVWVIDDREKYANVERFPQAQRLIVGDIGRELQALKPTVGPNTYCLIVTRGHNHDEEALYHVASTPAGYIGMIGSKRKVRLIFDDLLQKGISEAALAKVHAPVGLEIGSQTVPEIAVSIVAELIARRNLGEVPAAK